MVLVPNLVGSPPREAPVALQRVGLVLGRVSGSGDVIDSQEPAAGKRVPGGSKVNITLARTPLRGQLVAVPDLVNRTVNEARMALSAVGLILGNKADGSSRVRNQTPAGCSRANWWRCGAGSASSR
ncbi:MAG: PASTA domain-containing protein [Pseudonocardiaceae bacterium]